MKNNKLLKGLLAIAVLVLLIVAQKYNPFQTSPSEEVS